MVSFPIRILKKSETSKWVRSTRPSLSMKFFNFFSFCFYWGLIKVNKIFWSTKSMWPMSFHATSMTLILTSMFTLWFYPLFKMCLWIIPLLMVWIFIFTLKTTAMRRIMSTTTPAMIATMFSTSVSSISMFLPMSKSLDRFGIGFRQWHEPNRTRLMVFQ